MPAAPIESEAPQGSLRAETQRLEKALEIISKELDVLEEKAHTILGPTYATTEKAPPQVPEPVRAPGILRLKSAADRAFDLSDRINRLGDRLALG